MDENFKKIKLGYFLFLLSFLVLSCAEENPDLVNPPAPNETVRIRFFNYAKDKKDRKLSIEQVQSPLTSWKQLSPPVMPPAKDSVLLSTIFENNHEYTDSTKLRLWRDSRYVVFGLHKPYSTNPLDTLIVTITAFAPVRDTTHCYISLININDDYDAKYSVVLGCPNGNTVFPAMPYLQKSAEREVPSGTYPVSIIKVDENNNRTSLGLFNLKLNPLGDYLFVVMGDTPDDIKLINRRDDTPGAMQSVELISSSTAKIRTINFSNSDISAKKVPNDNFLPSLSAQSISDYNSVTACTSDYLDSILISTNGNVTSIAKTALVVNDFYSLLVFDTDSGEAASSMIVRNLGKQNYPENSAAVRVVNMAQHIEAFSVSLGVRDNPSSDAGYIAGEQLATDLEYGKITQATFVLGGRAPITIFSATSPQRLLHSFIGKFEAGKNYLLVITGKNNADAKVSIIDESTVNTSISNLEEGVYAQIAHFIPEVDSARISIDKILTNIKLYYSNSIATVLPIGSNTIRYNNIEETFTCEKDYRDLLVTAGTKDEPEFIHIHSHKMADNDAAFNRRVLNVAKDVPTVTVYDADVRQDTNIYPIVTDLQYKKASDPQAVFLERKFSYFFFDKIRGNLLMQANDISMSFGKNYTIIFGGNNKVISEDPLQYNYSILLLQEY